MSLIEKGKTVGIFGMKGTGKTYLTRELIHSTTQNAIVFDTIGAIKPNNATMYEVEATDFTKQALLFTEIASNTQKNVGVNLSNLVPSEIVKFTDWIFTIINVNKVKNKTVFVDEIADYLPQIGEKSKGLERMIRHGRNEGWTFVFNTQRPAYITKNVLNLVDVAIFFRLNWERDLIVVKDLLNNLGKDWKTKEIIKITNLPTGKYIYYKFAT